MSSQRNDLVITRWGARFQGRQFPCAIGRGGIGPKQGEGDGITPIGHFQLTQVHYRPDRLKLTHSATPIHLNTIWSDAPDDPDYNTLLRCHNHPYSHENLRRPDPLYNAIGILNYNWPTAIPGKGSAIFLHIWRKPRHPTEGCITFSKTNLLRIFANWTKNSRVIIRA